jgi:hypothetical protein
MPMTSPGGCADCAQMSAAPDFAALDRLPHGVLAARDRPHARARRQPIASNSAIVQTIGAMTLRSSLFRRPFAKST